MPTLNAFDNGDIRTTILITTANVVGTLQARDYKGVGNQYVAEDKLIIEQSIVFYGNRVDDIRIQDDKVNTLQARMGTGGNNMPLVATIFSHTQGLDAQPSETLSPTLRAGGAGMAVSYSPSGFADYSEGMGTLKAGMTNNNSPLVAVDEYNGSTDETHHTLRAKKDSTGVMNDMTVRRLTPIECERLQGFPDNWTEGQSDSARYKQMGNAVAVPVVEWIIGNICDTLKEAE
jgi:DNA (cytosine-5)-methyltransferase 1